MRNDVALFAILTSKQSSKSSEMHFWLIVYFNQEVDCRRRHWLSSCESNVTFRRKCRCTLVKTLLLDILMVQCLHASMMELQNDPVKTGSWVQLEPASQHAFILCVAVCFLVLPQWSINSEEEVWTFTDHPWSLDSGKNWKLKFNSTPPVIVYRPTHVHFDGECFLC